MTSDTTIPLEVTSIVPIATGVHQVRLEHHDRTPLPPWTPGAHIDLVLPNGLVRQYSLCGDPAERNAYLIGVLLAPQSRGGSEYVHTHLHVGDTVPIRGPRNNFAFTPRGRALFIAGGIGITPIYPMIQEAQRIGTEWSLVYGGRTSGSMAFASELRGHRDKVQLVPEDENGFLDLAALLGEPKVNTEIYCCGPSGLLDAVQATCKLWPAGSLHLERFSATAAPEPTSGFVVVAERSGVTCRVAAGESIVDALAAVGVIVPTSCGEGVCGTCETKVLEGVPDHRDSLLGDSEREAGTSMLICVSRSESPHLVLDL